MGLSCLVVGVGELHSLVMSLFQQLVFSVSFVVLASGAENPVILGVDEQLSAKLRGELVVGELGCTACHDDMRGHKEGPRLAGVAKRVRRDYFIDYILKPHEVKPGTTMPDLLSKLPEGERQEAAVALADYLWVGQEDLKLEAIAEDAVARGKKVYHEVGCVACHNPEGEQFEGSSSLIGLEKKYSVKSLTEFLENPLESRPSGRMPDMRLSHWEAGDLANYLLRDQKEEGKPKAERKSSKLDGEAYFRKLGCAQCHEPEQARKDFATAFAKLDLSQECTSASYSLSPEQKEGLAKVKAAELPEKMPLASQVHLKMAQLNCFACHQRDELGGVADERDEFFTTTNLNLGEQARIPPSLTGVGVKLKPAALRRILISDGSVRPYMNTRMPRFGSENVEELVEWLGATDHAEEYEITRLEDKAAAMKAGHELVGEKNLACNACHTFFGEKSTTLNALDLTAMWERLQEGWFHRYMRNPQEFHSSTIMPSFWPNGKSVRPEILGGNADKQIDAIWQYLSKGQESRRPAGVRPDPIPYGPTNDEAVMLRRQYTGVGKRGIGVGYPSGINLIFDAERMSLNSIWRGDFAEMSPVWRGQGSGFVKEAGEGLVRFPAGPGFAKLEAIDGAWPVVPEGERAAGFDFLGYSLDEKQRPDFRYRFEGVEVLDSFRDLPNGPRLRRTVAFSEALPKGFFLRIAKSEEENGFKKSGEDWVLSNGLLLRSSAPVTVVSVGEGQELRVALAGQEELRLNYYYSEL